LLAFWLSILFLFFIILDNLQINLICASVF